MKKKVLLTLLICTIGGSIVNAKPIRLLVMSKTAGFRHQSIPVAKMYLDSMAIVNGWRVDYTEDSMAFNDYKKLRRYNTIIFLHTTGTILDSTQKEAFKKYIRNGGGFVSVHTGTDTEKDWPWYMQMVGAKFKSHPKQQQATFQVVDNGHPATKMLPKEWSRFDELYNYTDTLGTDIHVLITLDEGTYQGGTMGSHHPMAWYQNFEGGRVFQTALGHTDASFRENLFMEHLKGGILWACGKER